MLRTAILAAALLASAAAPVPPSRDIWLIEGRTGGGTQPDGNSVFLGAPGGLILVDTGRHKAHQAKLIAFARARPVAAIVNTHWHLDHSGGNAELRALWPRAPLYASRAVEGALAGFLAESRKEAEAYIASGRADPATVAEIRGDFAAMDAPAALIPDRPVAASGPMRIAGRSLRVNLAEHAATEGDVWLYDPAARIVIAGDLVVAHLPYFDTACAEGWRRALGAIAATPFRTLIPGHGAPMTRGDFLVWRKAFDALLDCAASAARDEACIAAWTRDAARFIPAGGAGVDEGLRYYLKTRLRAPPAERGRYCPEAA